MKKIRFLNMQPEQMQRREQRIKKRKFRAKANKAKKKKKRMLLKRNQQENERQGKVDHAAADIGKIAHANHPKA